MTKKTSKNDKGKSTAEAVEKGPSPDVKAAPSDPVDRLSLFEDVLGRWPSVFPTQWTDWFAGETAGFRIEEFTDGDDLVIRGEIPGVDPDSDIEIEVDNGRLSIRAEREQHTETEDGYRSEFRYGSFARVLPLPEGACPDEVSAAYTDGILEVRVPVDAERRAQRKVAISRG